MPERPAISTISDTAHLIAWHRAEESKRPDALFLDPLADRLAGERGRLIAAAAPRRTASSNRWFVARTKLIDDGLYGAIKQGCNTVVNLAAGLDTRPYRLDLPGDLTWVEADLPELMREKNRLLAGAHANCQLTREVVDVTDSDAVNRLLDDALGPASKAFVLTEGLLMYLEDECVEQLSIALDHSGVNWWTFDIFSPGLRKLMNRLSSDLNHNARFTFAPENGIEYFEKLGWTTVEVESLLSAAYRFDRLPRWMRLAARFYQPDPRKPGSKSWWGTATMSRLPQ